MTQLFGVVFILAIVSGVGAQVAAAGVPEPECNKIWERTGKGFYENNKPYTDERTDTGVWTTSTPAAENMNGTKLSEGIAAMAKSYKRLRSVLIIRHGKLISENYVNGGSAKQSNNVHSASKSILQAVLGIAIQKGYISSLEAKASTYLPSSYFTGQPTWKKEITIKQLIDMNSKLAWTEDVTEESSIAKAANWVEAIIHQPGEYKSKTEPSNTFNYSTGNTHILSNVIAQATGMSYCAFAEKELFSELGIAPEHWGRDPQAVYSGGYNLYLTARELALFGQLYMNKGKVGTTQLVPTATVTQAETPLSHEPGEEEFFYDQGWWSRTISGTKMFFAWGFEGQFVYVIPSLNIVFVTTENTEGEPTEAEEVNSGSFIEKTLIPAVTGP